MSDWNVWYDILYILFTVNDTMSETTSVRQYYKLNIDKSCKISITQSVFILYHNIQQNNIAARAPWLTWQSKYLLYIKESTSLGYTSKSNGRKV